MIIVVLGVMLAYEEFESRFLVPKVYGNALRSPARRKRLTLRRRAKAMKTRVRTGMPQPGPEQRAPVPVGLQGRSSPRAGAQLASRRRSNRSRVRQASMRAMSQGPRAGCPQQHSVVRSRGQFTNRRRQEARGTNVVNGTEPPLLETFGNEVFIASTIRLPPHWSMS